MGKSRKKAIILFLTPALIFFLLTFIYPIIRTIVMSFFEIENITSGMDEWKFRGFQNYNELFHTPIYLRSLKNLWDLWFWGGIGVIALGILFAFVLSSGVHGKKFFRAVMFMPYLTSAIAMATMWQMYVYSDRYGLLKFVIDGAGWSWLDPEHRFMSMVIAYCFGMVGYHVLIFLSGIEKIGTTYYEAATLDGAGKIAQLFHITVPLLRGTFRTSITMWSVTSVAFFTWSMVFGGIASVTPESVVMPMNYLYTQVFGGINSVAQRNAGVGAAIGIILAFFVLVIFGVTSWLFREKDLEY